MRTRPPVLPLLPLLFALFALTALAQASPPDPTWIAGFYDDADYDDVVVAVTGMTATPDAAPPVVSRPCQIVLGPVLLSVPEVISRSPLRTFSVRAPPIT
jgi:hypothetical protein